MSFGQKFFGQMLDAWLEQSHMTVQCQTCGKVFLNISHREFMKVHGWKSVDGWYVEVADGIVAFDKWYMEAAVHWSENPEHTIIANTTPNPFNFSECWTILSKNNNIEPKEHLPWLRVQLALREGAPI